MLEGIDVGCCGFGVGLIDGLAVGLKVGLPVGALLDF